MRENAPLWNRCDTLSVLFFKWLENDDHGEKLDACVDACLFFFSDNDAVIGYTIGKEKKEENGR